jgi:hypothetical protein
MLDGVCFLPQIQTALLGAHHQAAARPFIQASHRLKSPRLIRQLGLPSARIESSNPALDRDLDATSTGGANGLNRRRNRFIRGIPGSGCLVTDDVEPAAAQAPERAVSI